MYPVIVCIAKKEHDYIEEFIKYHLALGFKYIYLYDNEDEPTYEKMLEKYRDNLKVIHLPFNNYYKPVQFIALDDFVNNYIFNNDLITHVTHIDIDEFIVLKKHKNICDFISEYIVDDCQGIGMNWRFFGSSGNQEKSNDPVTIRFTKCQKYGDPHIKTIFRKDNFLNFMGCHYVNYINGYTKSTNNNIIHGPFNHNITYDVIQLNHYKSKTLPEFKYIITRQRADVIGESISCTDNDIEERFNHYDCNEIEELTASNFYKNFISL